MKRARWQGDCKYHGMQIRKILAPTDFSHCGDGAVEYAAALAKQLGATLTILHAYELPVLGMAEGALVATAEVSGRIVVHAEKALAERQKRFESEGVKVETLIRQGIADVEIVEQATALGADLVVMGTHGRRGLSHILLGSVAERVVRTATVPVLTRRHAEPAA